MSKRNNYVNVSTTIKYDWFITNDPAEDVKKKPTLPKWSKKHNISKNEPDKYLKEEKE